MAKFFVYPFGISGDRAPILDPLQPSGVVSYQEGFPIDYQLDLLSDPDALPIPRDQSNQLYYDITNGIRQYQTEGNPDWITSADNLGTSFPYDLYAVVRYNDGSGVKLFMSLVSSNTATPSTGGVTDPSWREVSSPSLPIGSIIDWGSGASAPAGLLTCDGSAISRTTFATLFAVIGTTWGIGDGSTTFNIPNLARRNTIGAGGTGTSIIGNAVGNIGGTETRGIAQANFPPGELTGCTVRTVNVNCGPGGQRVSSVSLSGGNTPSSTSISLGGSGVGLSIVQPGAITNKIIKYI